MATTNYLYLNALKARIAAIKDCKELAEFLEKQVKAYYKTLIDDVTSKIAILGVLKEIPTDIDKVITWLTNFINTNIIDPYNKAILLEAQLVIEVTELISLVESKIASLTCNIARDFDMSLSGFKVPQLGTTNLGLHTFGAG